MKRYVLKFGGSSVETIEKMKIVASRIIERVDSDTELIIVVSAMGKTTSKLIEEARKITLYPNKRDLDLLLSTGELTSIAYLSIILNDMGYPAICLSGQNAKIYTNNEHQNSKILNIDTSVIEKHLKEKKIVIIAGYQGVNEHGDITTLGREGSDTSAVTLAYYLKCPCEIYSDVDGIYEIDPRIIDNSIKLEKISYNQLLQLSYNGAKVIATGAIDFAYKNRVPLYIASTFNEDIKGTIVTDGDDLDFAGIAVDENIRILNFINGLSFDTLNKFHNNGVRVDILSNNLVALSCSDLISLEEIINKELDDDDYEEEYCDYNLVKLSIIGKIFSDELVCDRLISELGEEMINVYLTKHNVYRFSIFINIDDVFLCIKKLLNIIKGKLMNEKKA